MRDQNLRWSFISLQALSFGLLGVAFVDYLFFGHHYQASQRYFVAGLVSLFAAAVVDRIRRGRAWRADKKEPGGAHLVSPAWIYVCAGALIVLGAVGELTTWLSDSLASDASLGFLAAVCVAVGANQYRLRRRGGQHFGIWQQAGIALFALSVIVNIWLWTRHH